MNFNNNHIHIFGHTKFKLVLVCLCVFFLPRAAPKFACNDYVSHSILSLIFHVIINVIATNKRNCIQNGFSFFDVSFFFSFFFLKLTNIYLHRTTFNLGS